MRTRPGRGSRRRDAGAAALEYVAAIALAGLLATSVVLPAQSARVGPVIMSAVCKVRVAVHLGEGCSTGPDGGPGTSTPPPDPTFDPKPTKCKITEHGEKVNSEIKIAFIKFGENAGFLQTTYSDGTVTYTATDGASIGLTGGLPGAKLDIGKVQRGVDVDFGGDFKVDYGSTWTFDNADQAAAMKKQLDDYLVEQEILKHNPEYAIKFLWSDAKKPPKPPNQTVSTITLEGSVDGSVGLSLPYDPDPDAKSGVPDLKLADFGLKFGGNNTWTQVTDTVAGTKTYTTGGEGYGQVHGSVGPLEGELKGVLGSSLAITRDKDNQVVKVTLVTTHEGKATGTVNGGQGNLGGNPSTSDSASNLTVTTAALDVRTPEQRALVDGWLAEQASDPNAYVSPETYFPDRLVTGDPFQNLMFTNATVSNVQYDKVTDKTGFAAEVKLGVAFGVDFSLETNDALAAAATYLGVPGSDGTRSPVDFPECVGG